ncbi:MAG: S8 family serine peptidase [Blastocatellia bacterium]
MKVRLAILLILVCATLILAGKSITSAYSNHQESQASAQRKIAPWVMEHTEDGQEAEFLVILADKADLMGAKELQAKQEKGRFVRDALLQKARQSQASLLEWLQARGIEHRSFYVVNAVWVKATREVAMEIAARTDVARIEGNPRIRNLEPVKITEEELRAAIEAAAAPAAPAAVEPGVNYIRAPEVWSQGFTGQGLVIGGQDTGVEWNHPALINHYRGWNGSTADHNYNWHDSIHSGGGSCGPNSPAPCDDNNHGTHTLGTAVGSDGGTNQIGVAPGAKFIACRNMDQGNGTPATYIECMEWFLAPYPVGGNTSQGDPSKAPDITTNSWGCPPSEGCSPGTLQAAIESQRAAGIMTVVAAGNSGSACSTVVDPPSLYDAAYTIGAFSSSTGTIASFSSRGPVTIDGSNRRKPDISAPGVSVRSAVRGGGYSSLSGTSMATPHTAGAIALLWSSHPELRHQITDTENILNDAAVDVSSTACSSNGVPNNTYGFGRLDIKAAVDVAAASISPTSQNFVSGGGTGAVNVTAPAGVGWQTFVNDSWITVTSGGSGTGNGTVNYSVAANSGSARTGTMIIAGRIFTVTQDAPSCTYSISPASANYTSAGGAGSASVTAGAGCAWTAASNDAWITITSGASGTGNGTVNYSVAANSGSARTGTMTIAGLTFTVTQASAATNTGWLSPTANAAVTSQAGDNNGYEVSAANASADDNLYAVDNNSGTNSSTSCTANSKDKHRFHDYGISIPGGATIQGIEVQLNAKVDSATGSPRFCVQLSWNGGTMWTATKSTATLSTSELAYVLGGAADTWGRTWSAGELSNANFRVRIIDVAGSTSRDFSLDWVAVRVSYQP